MDGRISMKDPVTEPVPARRRGATRWVALAAAGVLLAGAVAGFTVSDLNPWRSEDAGSDAVADGRPSSVQELDLPGGPQAAGPASPRADVRVPRAAGRTPAAAVSAYLDARSKGDNRTSYALLSPASQEAYPTEAIWLDALPDLPAPGTFRVRDSRTTGGTSEVTVEVDRRPVLDPFAGFVPARSIEVYGATRSPAGWRVDTEPVSVEPSLVSDRTAEADVAAWLSRVAACDGAGAVALQTSPDLLGDDSLPGTICTESLRLRTAPAQALSGEPSTAAFLAAYGPEMGTWARLVPVQDAERQLLVGVAPLGASWRVFGIVTSEGG